MARWRLASCPLQPAPGHVPAELLGNCLSLPSRLPSRPSPPQVVKSPIYETPELTKTVATKVATGLITSHLIMSYPIVLNPPERALETTLEPHVPLPPLVPPPGFTHGGPAGSRRRRLRRPSTL